MINDVIDYIFGGLPSGYMALAFKYRNGKFVQRFKKWPEERGWLTEERLAEAAKSTDVYFCPALYKEPKATKNSAFAAHVVWADLDTPVTSWPVGRSPGLVVASGSPGRQHAYWRSEKPLETWEVEAHNHKLVEEFGADTSGWDVTQLLRLPGTFNWKTDPPGKVQIYNGSGKVFDLPTVERLHIPILQLNTLRDITPQLDDYLQEQLALELRDGRGVKLYHLACYALEHGWTPNDTRSLVDHADRVYGKFVKRNDRDKRLDELVARALAKQPKLTVIDFDPETPTEPAPQKDDKSFVDLRRRPRSIGELRKTARPVEWVVEGLLRKRGLFYLAGPAGVGKSTFALNLSLTLAVGRPNFLDLPCRTQGQRVLYASHEMDDTAVLYFVNPMLDGWQDPELDLLETNFKVVAHGSRIALNEPAEQQYYEKLFARGEFDGFVVDTLGASTSSSLQDEQAARGIADWLDRIRQKYGIWVVVLAHPRKAPPGKGYYEFRLDDMYGSRLFGDRADTVLIVQESKRSKKILELRAEKTRFTGGTTVKHVTRTSGHWFKLGAQPSDGQPLLVVQGEEALEAFIDPNSI